VSGQYRQTYLSQGDFANPIRTT